MKRREFLQGLAVWGVGSIIPNSKAAPPPRVAITIDDFNWAANPVLFNPAQRNAAILRALREAKVQAALFVCGKYIDGEKADEGLRLLGDWNDAGHLIGNHTYSHGYFPDAVLEEYEKDILKCEKHLSPAFSNFRKIFRFPYLKEGDTAAQRDGMRQFLDSNGYQNGHVTIDTSDWYIDQRLRERLTANKQAAIQPYRQYYLDHIYDRACFYEKLGKQVLQRSIPHTILLHHNTAGALFLGDAISMFRAKGWTVVDAAEAFADPVYTSKPNVLPAGESLMIALAKQAGGPDFDSLLRYPGEDSKYEKSRMDELGL